METKSYKFEGEDFEGFRIVHVRGDKRDYKVSNSKEDLLLIAKDDSQEYSMDDFDAVVYDFVMVHNIDETTYKSVKDTPLEDTYTHVLITKNTFSQYFRACLRNELLGNPLGREKSVICEILTGK